ncbi:MAG: FtsX-like permease family protein [Methylobacter sp.]|uniref:FtsX-like permease family protein n=1 Tax=Methylobacter sp. TaxID=2051955 RepID=UPI00272F7AD8|nr:FtsX-like permease family protein [Methylobacter sp.]MDP1666276.1 FtsX-like permease family protein [Methylobacter sp.]
MFFNSNLWQKVSADLLTHKSRTVLAISSIAIGLFVIGTLLGMMDLQLGSMDNAHRQSQPSHINLILKQDADIAVAESIKNLDGVADIDTLTQFTVQFKTPQSAQWQTGTVLFRADYQDQQYDRMTLLSGNFPRDKTIAVERLSARFAGLNTGDTIEFSTANGTEKLAIDGIIRHPFVKPPAFGGQLHFFIAPELATAFGIPAHTFRQLLVQIKPPYSGDKARSIAGEIRAKLAVSGIAVNATLLQDPGRHWGRAIFSGIHLVLTVMAWASLALSSVLILNTVAALITQQTDQIGIMKALGARRRTIANIYLSEVFILSLIALLIAVPLSWAGAFYSSRWILDVFNIELNSFVYSSRSLYLMIAGGLLAPLLASLRPIWKGASMSVRQAIASYGLGADFVSHGVDRWLERAAAALLPTIYAVALGNLLRRKARLLWTQSVLIIAGVLFIVIMSLIASVNLTLNNELARSRYAVRIGFTQDQPADIVKDIVRNIPPTTAVEFWNRLPAELFLHDKLIRQSGSLGLQMIALPSDTSMYRPLIVAGRWFEPADDQQNRLVINAATAELNGIHVGDRLNARLLQQPAREWQVIGLYRWFAGSGYAVEPVYAPLSTLQPGNLNEHKHAFALLSANISSLAEEKTYVDTLKTAFEQQHIKLDFYTTLAKLEQRQFAENQFRPITGMLLGLAVMIAAVGAIGLSGTLAIGVLQRTREIGVLRAIGASSSAIFKLFMLEGLFHGLLAWLISIPLAFLVAEPLAEQLGITMLGIHLDFVFSLLSVGFWLGFVLILAMLAAYFPARNASKIAVRAGLSY